MAGMNWLFKEEPTNYNFDELVKDKKTVWSGVKNPLAQKHLRAVRRGDRIFYYHTGREKAIVGIARAVADGRVALHPGADVASTTAALKELPGIGDWTAQYIAMRALRWPDAFPAGDVALHKALGVQQGPQPARAAEAASQAWKPWRSYAVVRAWSSLAQGA